MPAQCLLYIDKGLQELVQMTYLCLSESRLHLALILKEAISLFTGARKHMIGQ